MSAGERPLVYVLTPVYNGEPYLAECIESVLAQSYENWVYFIVNNRSTDRTLEIAEAYAAKDGRIRVHDNEAFLGIVANHNRAFRLVPDEAKYCKVVSADDWILPECIVRMVELAEAHPSVGVVGSYQLAGGDDEWYVRNDGLPYLPSAPSGRAVCRLQLLGEIHVFGTPTSSLYRADLVRKTSNFLPNETPEADVAACYECLREADYGFVHQVLSYERLHGQRATHTAWTLNAHLPSKIHDCITYGPLYLKPDELEGRFQTLMDQYYSYLGLSTLNFRDKNFWAYHKGRLEQLGHPLNRLRLGKALFWSLLNLALNPKSTFEEFVRRRSRPTPT